MELYFEDMNIHLMTEPKTKGVVLIVVGSHRMVISGKLMMMLLLGINRLAEISPYSVSNVQSVLKSFSIMSIMTW
jgi:hypothetical protein